MKKKTVDFSEISNAHVSAFRSLDPDDLVDVEILDPEIIRGSTKAVKEIVDMVDDILIDGIDG